MDPESAYSIYTNMCRGRSPLSVSRRQSIRTRCDFLFDACTVGKCQGIAQKYGHARRGLRDDCRNNRSAGYGPLMKKENLAAALCYLPSLCLSSRTASRIACVHRALGERAARRQSVYGLSCRRLSLLYLPVVHPANDYCRPDADDREAAHAARRHSAAR